jgi:type IV secretion system protein VirD4
VSQRHEPHDLIAPAAVLGLLCTPVAALWTTGVLAGLTATGRPAALSFADTLRTLLRLPGHLSEPQLAWPSSARSLLPADPLELQVALAVSWLLILTVLASVLSFALRSKGHSRRDRAAGFAGSSQLAGLHSRTVPPRRVVIGRHGTRLIAAEPRASILLIGPSQSGKTSGLVTPALLEWAGPVIATSIKGDLVNDTRAARAQHGEVRIFDPTGSSGLPASPWSPLAASRDWTAARRTSARLLGVGQHATRSADEAFWRPAGARFLAPLLLAAAHGRLAMRDVLSWTATVEQDEPTQLLNDCRDPGAQPALDALRSVWDADPRFRSSLIQTVATALDAWQEPRIAAATVNDSKVSPDWLLSAANSLYLVCPADDQRRLAGLFTALLSDVVAGAFAAAARTGRPIDPPLLLCLDEAANIAPLPNLDELASTGAGQGVQLLTVFQDISQAAERWGRERAETIIANHRGRVFTPGIGDRATLEYLSHTLGEEEITRIATHRAGPLAHGSRTRSSEFKTLAPPNRVREQEEDSALLVYGRLPPAWIQLRPWFRDRRLRAIAAANHDPRHAERNDPWNPVQRQAL